MKKQILLLLITSLTLFVSCKEDDLVDDSIRQSPKLTLSPDITQFTGKVGDVLKIILNYENVDGHQRNANSILLTKTLNNIVQEEIELLNVDQKQKPFNLIQVEYTYTLQEAEIGHPVRLSIRSESELITNSGGRVFSVSNKNITITTTN